MRAAPSSIRNKPGVISDPSRLGQGMYVSDDGIQSGALERAIVLEVFPDTHTVLISTVNGTFPATLVSATAVSGDGPTPAVALPFRGSEVLVTWVGGRYHILGYVPPADPAVLDADIEALRFSLAYDKAGGTSGHYKNKGYTRRSGLSPAGLLPGDSVQVGRWGNIIGLLDGGIALLKAHDMAQVAAFMHEQLVKIVARNYKLFTDFGLVEHTADDTGANLRIRGAGGLASEASSEQWTIRGDLGVKGDLVNLGVTSPTGFDLAKVHSDRAGNIYILTKDLITETLGNITKRVTGTISAVVDKAASLTYKDSLKLKVEKLLDEELDSHVRKVANSSLSLVMGDDTETVAGAKTLVITDRFDAEVTSGPYSVTVGADASDAKDVSFNIKNGSFKIDIDDAGDLVATTPNGKIKLTTQLGSVILDTKTAEGSVLLGAESATYHVVKFEQLKSLLNAMAGAMDSHNHTVSGAATTALTSPGLFSNLVNSAVSTVKSTVVKVSG